MTMTTTQTTTKTLTHCKRCGGETVRPYFGAVGTREWRHPTWGTCDRCEGTGMDPDGPWCGPSREEMRAY